ncbi:YoaK family protein [Kitasatospora sp. NPDC018058]|uniref:YoaK family protein n=1 Tax=Kitasatospora sp. NPDC018058 TaxID=3364025 RepID=UPI0037BFD7DE
MRRRCGDNAMAARSRRPDTGPLAVRVSIALTLISGLIDAISFLGLGHVFTANMTGNVILIGFAAVGTPGFTLVPSLIALAGFLAGAAATGRFQLAVPEGPRRILGVLGAEAVLLAGATGVAATTGVRGIGSRSVTIVLLALAMGVRNTTARKLAIPDLTTTMLTMTLVGLASESSLAGGPNVRTGRRVAAVAALLLGAGAGAVLLRGYGAAWALLVTVGCVVLTGTGYALAERNRRSAREA